MQEFSRQYSATRKSFAVMSSMDDLDVIYSRRIFYTVCARCRIYALADDLQALGIIAKLIHPLFFSCDELKDLFSQRNSRATWCIFLLCMLGLFQDHFIFFVRSHQAGQAFIYFKENIYPYTIIA